MLHILSLNYLLFVGVLFLAYYLTPLKARWMLLLAASVVFYALSGWQGLVYLLALSGITYGAALAIESQGEAKGRRILVLTLTAVLGAMVVLKYADAVLRFLKAETASAFVLWQPLGLSWFTFQTAGYVIDVSRGKVQPERNFLKYLLFVSFFPQMSQGPISSFEQLAPQLKSGHRLEPVGVTMGFQRMLWGYFKKLVLADRLAAVTVWMLSDVQKPGWLVICGAAIYLIRLYADFSGGMDIILGTAMTFGITMTENFWYPFFALSVADYWRRWHITLGAWFRSYLLYPFTMSRFGRMLGKGATKLFGKRTGRLIPSAAATVLVFLLIGLWHGAHWNAAVYGLYFGILMGASVLLDGTFRNLKKKLGIRENHPAWKAFCLVRTWVLLVIAQFFAFTGSPAQAVTLLGASFANWGQGSLRECFASIMPGREWLIALCAGGILLVVDLLGSRGVEVNRRLAQGPFPIRWVLMLLLILAIVIFGCYGQGTSSAAFVYTQF